MVSDQTRVYVNATKLQEKRFLGVRSEVLKLYLCLLKLLCVKKLPVRPGVYFGGARLKKTYDLVLEYRNEQSVNGTVI